LAEIMAQHPSVEKVQRLCCEICARLSSMKAFYKIFLHSKGVKMMFAVLKRKEFSQDTIDAAMEELTHLTNPRRNRREETARAVATAFGSEGGIRLMLRLVQHHEDNKTFIVKCLTVLGHLCILDERNAQKLENEKGFADLLSIWSNDSDNEGICKAASGCIAVLITEFELQLEFRNQQHNMELLFDAMEKFPDNERLQSHLCTTLALLAATDADQLPSVPECDLGETILKYDGIAKVKVVMEQHVDSLDIQENIAGFLFYLAKQCNSVRQPMVEAGLDKAIHNAIKRHGDSNALRDLQRQYKAYKRACTIM